MDQNRLRTLLVELDHELKSTGALDARSRELLEQVLADVRKLDSPVSADRHQSAEGRLRELVLHFETEHPRLSGAVAQVADALGKLGI
ncbi:MAG: DUF4404 family protein [Gammaproteobacteria bacterium]|nr:DUF4404 family protein [Gammaproteobacteria bacterium]MDH5277410.1 DUF4404 family protein [Gammaproteobacteria bacterium]